MRCDLQAIKDSRPAPSRFAFHVSGLGSVKIAASPAQEPTHRACRVSSHAFSLLEVMIAMGIFFMAVFTILALVSQTLRNARALQQPQVDAGMVAAIYVSTNRFSEGQKGGDFGDDLRDYSWDTDTREYATNGLLIVDVILHQRGLQKPADAFQILVFDPTYRSGPFGGGFRR